MANLQFVKTDGHFAGAMGEMKKKPISPKKEAEDKSQQDFRLQLEVTANHPALSSLMEQEHLPPLIFIAPSSTLAVVHIPLAEASRLALLSVSSSMSLGRPPPIRSAKFLFSST
ncbi:hypothetical protein PIB30_009689 [Stylosanthes scabra]|uniref:Uncharacterized protein n=1 Tax=Stylosanthes scabra TaxID=79078 RepID=A0ABU6V3H8_9FABA|nr:hypothetical protein [Stylosanthes scabra]